MYRRIYLFFTSLFIPLLFSACAGSPKLIGSYPVKPVELNPIQETIHYTAEIELEVYDIDTAVNQANRLAYDWGGSVTRTDSRVVGFKRCTSMTVYVPSTHFNSIRGELYELGDLVHENLSGYRSTNPDRFQTRNSVILLTLCPQQTYHGRITMPNWNPFLTLVKAYEVSKFIFTRFIDTLIWLIVIVGPFAFITWLGVSIWKRVKK